MFHENRARNHDIWFISEKSFRDFLIIIRSCIRLRLLWFFQAILDMIFCFRLRHSYVRTGKERQGGFRPRGPLGPHGQRRHLLARRARRARPWAAQVPQGAHGPAVREAEDNDRQPGRAAPAEPAADVARRRPDCAREEAADPVQHTRFLPGLPRPAHVHLDSGELKTWRNPSFKNSICPVPLI